MFDLNRRQKMSLGKFFADVSLIIIAVVVIGNEVKPDIPELTSLIYDVLAFVSAIIAFIVFGTIDDDDETPKK